MDGSRSNMASRLLHGTIYATIFEADKLQGRFSFDNLLGKSGNPHKRTKRFLGQIKRFVLCRPEVVGAKLYATIDLERARVARTRMLDEYSNPRWLDSFRIYCAHTVTNIVFTVKENNPVGATLVGRAYLSVDELMSGQMVDRWIEILDDEKNPIHKDSRIHVKLQYFPISQDVNWSNGIRNPGFAGVPYTFFGQRQGCRVSLYPDAHVPEDSITEFLRSAGYYKPQRCWEDIFDAIENAKHLIYITGWSVDTNITLIRDPKRPRIGGDVTLGELLNRKAEQGVRVVMLVWDDRTSVPDFKRDGLMATHDQETRDFFQGTKVHCVLCPRNPDNGRSIVQGLKVSTMFTHHQKTVVVDTGSPRGDQKRSIVSFLGGIDLCDGRYDTRNHSLFRTLNTVHKDDFHQPNFPGSSIKKGGPREPWHDIHCRLEGPIAWDVLYNFEQRWKKQGGNQQLVYSLNELDRFIIRPSEVTTPEDLDTWNVQLFRSIDGGAAAGFPESSEQREEVGLLYGKDNVIEKSIQDAYILAIRRARRFIYIENQYFLGSSFDWKKSPGITIEDINALHLIPKEISLKIVTKIQAGERFSVYIVIPMWPEGIPESASVQAILDWQRRTIEMMYTDIYNALSAKGMQDVDAREYLTFFCLGNREVKVPGEYAPPEHPEPNTNYLRSQEARRFMIYVHSKMMIVDDEYIIVGSANINQRSMDGGRDSEIAMGGFQPHHLAGDRAPARGDIFGLRMALWCEHLLREDDTLLDPGSIECVRNVNSIADQNWRFYASDETPLEDSTGHLLRYPIRISGSGEISAIPGFEFFPDTKASVLGAVSQYLPPILTT